MDSTRSALNDHVLLDLGKTMNMAAMSGISSQHKDLVVTFWTPVNTVITFELLPLITLLAKISTMVNTVSKIAFRAKWSLVRF